MSDEKNQAILTNLEAAYLTAVLLLGDDAFGARIFEKAGEVADPVRLSYGSLYTTLERLERQGFLTSRVGESIKARGGRGPRYFALTGAGESALKRTRAFAQSIDGHLRPAWGDA